MHFEREVRVYNFQTHEQLLSYYHDELSSSSTGRDSDTSLYCMQFPKNMSSYPHCFEKMQWLRTGWKSHKCYASLGVDGSICSFRHYLSLVENHCPPTNSGRKRTTVQQFAETNTDLQRLFNVLVGHNLYISSDKATLLRHVDEFPISSPCPPQDNRLRLDLIITDIIGLRSFKKRRDFLVHHKCRIRLVDSFGTHVEFNYRLYFNAHQSEFAMKGTKQKNPWGGHGLQLLQHWTFFPHTPDNGFLGFAIHSSDVEPMFERGSHELPASLVYGKERYMWSESANMINVLTNLTEVHATVADVNDTKSSLFSNVINHGFLNSTEIASLLRSVNIFVGLGFPFEGPAPLEAIAHGAVFINPKFDPPKSRLNTVFFRDKPTLREFTSQSPYMERLGKPYVYTVDINDDRGLTDAIKSALKEKSLSFLSFSLVGCTHGNLSNSTAPHAPYNCSLQSSSLMFSCASRPPPGSGIIRICPCRDHLPGQLALCKECVH
ncbi:hypothetical protein ANCCAN_15604 [Ancylostoma caninum]|uniref:alpha-1,6-mannosyl-glycoprotein 6-beta-N-acetylglucosaminyltransferase n=1 Tax=Ancylostoma caninum TaxID=29170 RepID=A0A368G727_ANCCA|nr:hypothetical protein ANCCAN_15604 [Ancylostoma caninum]